jgi:hypothetical protein
MSIDSLLIQIVPSLRPGRCGISDHGIALAHELQATFGISSVFVALNACSPGDTAFPLLQTAPEKLLETCNSLVKGRPGTMLVHLSGYGYSPDGVPAMLAAALTQVKASGRFRIAVYFHELFAVGPPWKSAFWYSRRQQKAVRAIAELCDLPVTNTSYHADWLEQQLGDSSRNLLRYLPVFSTVGEAGEPAPFARRSPAMVVFGLPGARLSSYKQLGRLGDMLKNIGIREFLDIGPPFDVPSDVKGIAVKRMGELPVAEFPGVLSAAMFGFVHHPSFCLAKSSIFASYCAHGVIPVIAESFVGEVDGLTEGLHLVTPMTAAVAKIAGWEACSRAAWKWYMTHRVRLHAEEYAKWMGNLA